MCLFPVLYFLFGEHLSYLSVFTGQWAGLISMVTSPVFKEVLSFRQVSFSVHTTSNKGASVATCTLG